MGKIGDLIVRLQLKHEDYEKGLKKASKSTNSFASTLGKIKGAGVAVWAAIGAAATKVAKDMISSTNQMEDKWAMFTAKATAGWDTFIRALSNGDFSNFITKFKENVAAAQYMAEALDANTEVENSIKLQKSAMAEELAALEVLMRDQTKSYEERAAAAKKYMDKVAPIYDQEIERLRLLKQAQMVNFGKGLVSPDKMSNHAMAMVEKFLVEYGKNIRYKELGGRTLSEVVPDALRTRNNSQAELDAQMDARHRLAWLSQTWGWGENSLFNLIKQYETVLNGEGVTELVNSIIAFNDALAAKDKETKKVQGIYNSAIASIQKSEKESKPTAEPARKDLSGVIADANMLAGLPFMTTPQLEWEFPDIITDEWLERNRQNIDAALAEAERMAVVAEQISRTLESAIVSSLSGATQALIDSIMGLQGADATQVLSALLQPFADTATSLGEMLIAQGVAIVAFKQSLKSLNGYAAIAAGTALIAVGAAMSSGIRALAQSQASASTTSASSSSTPTESYKNEQVIYVKGKISGSDIIIAGDNQKNKWAK